MHTSRKQFLKNAGLLLGGSALLKQNIFAGFNKHKTNTCLQDLFAALDLTSDDTDFNDDDIIKISDVSYAKNPVNSNCLDVQYDDENDGHCYDQGDDCDDSSAALKYDVFYPPYDNYTNCPLPAVIFVHEGGFSDCSDKDGSASELICKEFAKRYFVCFNVEYRRGIQIDNTIIDSPYTTVQQELGTYRTCQDTRGAIRTIISRANNPGNDFKIDTNFIFLAGKSAGSVALLNAAYYPTQDMNDQIFPKKAGAGNYTIEDVLGPINADYYDSDPDSDYLSSIAGILNQWGSISLPYSYFNNNESDFFADNSKLPPVIIVSWQAG